MMRMTIRSEAGRTTISVEGRLAGASVGDLRATWLQALDLRKPAAIRIDLADVTFVDADGVSFLRAVHDQGAELTATDVMSRGILDEIRQGPGP